MVVVVFGLPGSGKSFFAEKLAQVLQATYISSDQVRKAQFPGFTYTLKEKKVVYQRMVLMGKKALNNGRMVIMDGTFYLKSLRKMIYENFENYRIHFIEVTASLSLIKERVSQKRTFSDADFKIYKKIEKIFQPMKTSHLKLNSTNQNLDEMISEAELYLNLKNVS